MPRRLDLPRPLKLDPGVEIAHTPLRLQSTVVSDPRESVLKLFATVSVGTRVRISTKLYNLADGTSLDLSGIILSAAPLNETPIDDVTMTRDSDTGIYEGDFVVAKAGTWVYKIVVPEPNEYRIDGVFYVAGSQFPNT